MTNVVPNQTNTEASEDKEKEIIENGGENTTDKLANIKLLERDEYNALSDEEKPQYVKYSPSLTSQAYVAWMNAQNGLIKQYNNLCSAISKTKDLEGMNFISKVYDQIEPILDAFKEAIDAIGEIASTLGKLGLSKLVDILTAICKMIGALAGMIYTMIANPYNMLVQYKQAFEQIDTDAIKEQFNGETTPNIERESLKVDEIVIPDKEIEEYVKNGKDNLLKQKEAIQKKLDEVEIAKTTIDTAQMIQDTIKTVFQSTATLASAVVKVAEDEMDNSYQQVIKETSKDYSDSANSMVSGVNDFIHSMPIKYIKISDLQTLKEIQAERESKEDNDSEESKEDTSSTEEKVETT